MKGSAQKSLVSFKSKTNMHDQIPIRWKDPDQTKGPDPTGSRSATVRNISYLNVDILKLASSGVKLFCVNCIKNFPQIRSRIEIVRLHNAAYYTL
jgi:ribosomal protein L32E